MTIPVLSPGRTLPAFSWVAVAPAAAVLGLALIVTSGGYGYERDELYFRMLPPAWGYVDQPPLTPQLVRGISLLDDSTWAIRVPAILLAMGSLFVVALIAREVGGGRSAQALAAWGIAVGAFTLIAGHVFLTASWDLVVWPLVVLAVFRARLRVDPRWWLLAGGVAGLSLLNKLLVVVLLVCLLVGILIVGPRRGLVNRWTVGAVVLALVLGSPSIVYQLTHGLPQLEMGAALSAHKSASVRPEVLPLLLVWISPVLAPVWVAGLVTLVRRPELRPIRFYWLAFTLVVLLVIVMGTQAYYPYGALTPLFAVGCVPTIRWARTRTRRAIVGTAVGLAAAVNVVLALPVIPATLVGRTPIPDINQTVADSIGWPTYAQQIADVYRSAGEHAVVLAGNYGEAGALDRYAPTIPTYSGQNALWDLGPPPADTLTIVAVDGEWLTPYFRDCRIVTHLDNELGVDNEEQGNPVSVCTGPTVPISDLWVLARHLD